MVGQNAKSPVAQIKAAEGPVKGKPPGTPPGKLFPTPPQKTQTNNNGNGPANPANSGKPAIPPAQSPQGGNPGQNQGQNQGGNLNMKRSFDGAPRRGGPRGGHGGGGGGRGGGGFRGRGDYHGGRGGGRFQGGPRPNHGDKDKSGDASVKSEDSISREIKPQPKNMVEEREMGNETTTGGEKKFTGRCRLFVGNLPNDTKEDEFRKMFEQYGELSEVYLNTQRGFGFVRLDTRQNAEIAKAALDGLQKKGRVLRVRFATHGAALRVKHLGPYVSNELLEQAFGTFGTIERTVVIVDDRGKPTGEGIVEFARKPGAQQALTRINEGCYFLGATLRPLTVEPLDQKDEEDGLPEKFLGHNQAYQKERELQPRFAQRGSFEYEFGMKWKDLYRMEEDQRCSLERQIEDQHAKLEMEMGAAQIEHQAKLLHQDYLRKQEELKRMEEMHHQEMQRRMDQRRAEEEHRRTEEERRRQEQMVRQQQEEEMQRRREEQQQRRHGGRGGRDSGMFNGPRGGGGGEFGGDEGRGGMGRERNVPQMAPPPAPPAGLGIDRPRGGSMSGNMDNNGPMEMGDMNDGGQGGMGGPNGPEGNQANMPARQSRFDQPPTTMGFGGNMGGPGRNQGMGGPNQGMGGRGGGRGGGMGGRNQGNPGNMEGGNRQGMGGPGGPGGNMGSGGGGGGGGGGGPGPGSGSGPGPMNQGERGMMEQREQGGEEFNFESKRPRRY